MKARAEGNFTGARFRPALTDPNTEPTEESIPPVHPIMKQFLTVLAALLCAAGHCAAAILPVEKLLPDDTLALVTVPDVLKAREIYGHTAPIRFWNDPAMKAFKDKFVEKLKSQYITTLEHDLGIHLEDYRDLPQGQFTLAVVQNGWPNDNPSPGLLLLLDTRDKSPQLQTNLADLKKKWIDAGKTVRKETIRDVEFSVIVLDSKSGTGGLKKSGPGASETPEEAEKSGPNDGPKSELYVGQAESLLIVGNSPKVIEKILARKSGAAAKSLGEVASYEAARTALFHDAPAFGWINTKVLLDAFAHRYETAAQTGSTANANPLAFKPEKIIAALGLNGLKSIAAAYHSSSEGTLFNLMFGVPEEGRAGLFKLLAGAPKDFSPPSFVPASAVKFQRWRIDGREAWATVRKMVSDMSPQSLNAVDFMLSSAETAAKEKDPTFDLKRNLFGNLGDDVITYEKSPKGATLAELKSAPWLMLLGSPDPEQLANASKNVLALMGPQFATPTEREFLGHKIYTFSLPAAPGPNGAKGEPRSLSYACSGGYVALTTDAVMVEEYLRSSQGQARSLRDAPGLSEAMRKVSGGGTTVFGYSNEGETMRAVFSTLKQGAGSMDSPVGLAPLAAALGMGDAKIKDWFDTSLLPDFDKVSKYFYFSVYGNNTTAEGLSWTFFAPVPPQLNQ